MNSKRVFRCEHRDRADASTTAEKTDSRLRPQPEPAEPDTEPSRLDELERRFWDAQALPLEPGVTTMGQLPDEDTSPATTLDELQADFEERQDAEFVWDDEKKCMVPRRVRRPKRCKEQLHLPGTESSELDQKEEDYLRRRGGHR